MFTYLYNYNVNVIGIPISNNLYKTLNIIDLCDGIILSGGDNFLKEDFLVVNYLYNKNIPTLGICLGMQSIARLFSSKKEVLVKKHLSNDLYVHYVNINKQSLLYKILKKEKILVNSRHKSAIIDTLLDISAMSDDNVIEAVEDKNKKFFIGVEWHPESLDDENSKKLIEYFVNIL